MAVREYPIYQVVGEDLTVYGDYLTMESALEAVRSYNDGLAQQDQTYIKNNGRRVIVEFTRVTE